MLPSVRLWEWEIDLLTLPKGLVLATSSLRPWLRQQQERRRLKMSTLVGQQERHMLSTSSGNKRREN